MKKNNLKRIPIEDLKIGMVFADDVINSNGLILIPRNTIVLQKHIFRLKIYHIPFVDVIEKTPDPIIEDIKVEFDNRMYGFSDNQETFVEFYNTYQEKEENIKQHLFDVSEGKPIEMDDLLSVSSSLLKGLRTKSDLFNYLYLLGDSDDYTYSHSLNVSLLCNVFGHWLKLPDKKIEELTLAGLLHDIGKTQVNQEILNKPGKLTEKEFESIKLHAQLGYDLVKDYPLSNAIKQGILLHHEKIDGSGYPLGLIGDEIPEFAKIIGIVDIYDAMTSNRSYHKKFSPFQVIQVFEQESLGILDTKFLFVFLENIAHNYLGKMVRLSTGETAKIIFIHNNTPSRPLIEVGGKIVDLNKEPSIIIDSIL